MKVEEYRDKVIELLEAISKNMVAILTRMDIKKEIYTIETIEKKDPVKKPNATIEHFNLLPVKKPDAPKIEMGKVYNYKGKDGTPYTCNKCGGLISWDDRPTRLYPMHVDEEGHIVGDGDCSKWGG